MRTGVPMTIIRTVPEDEARASVAVLYAEERESLGYVPTHARVMAMNPAATPGVRGADRLGREADWARGATSS